jgi:hypothetical protein
VQDHELRCDILYSSPVYPLALSRSEGPVTRHIPEMQLDVFSSAERKCENSSAEFDARVCTAACSVYPFVRRL